MEELVDVVDMDNAVIGQEPRSKVRGENLLHRGVGILCCNSHGQVHVHQRTPHKDLFPSCYDMFVGGVVASGESYYDAALREIEEELGIRGRPLEHLFTHLYDGPRNRSFIEVFRVVYDGPIVTQESEIAWGDWIDEAQLPAWAEAHDIVPDGHEVYRHYLQWRSQGAIVLARLEEIFLYEVRRGPARSVHQAEAVEKKGLRGDRKRSQGRQVTILSRESWEEALAELATAEGGDPPHGSPLDSGTTTRKRLPAQSRRANLVLSGLPLPILLGKTLEIGDVRLRLREETEPCPRMDAIYPGLMAALEPGGRGGAIATVERGGLLRVGAPVTVLAE